MANILKTKLSLQNSAGLTACFLNNGSLAHIDAKPVRVSLTSATTAGKSCANLYLRNKLVPNSYKALLGPTSDSRFTVQNNQFITRGRWDDIDYLCRLQLSENNTHWKWQIDIDNTGAHAAELDLIYVQDVGLSPISQNTINQYYASQYLDRRILQHKDYGAVVCCRQNLKGPTGHPWLMIASKNSAVAGSVDGMQFYGKSFSITDIPEGLLSDPRQGEYAGELSVIALQESPFIVAPKSNHRSSFHVAYLSDHPAATSADDLALLPTLMNDLNYSLPTDIAENFQKPVQNLFSSAALFPSEDLTAAEIDHWFGNDKRLCETNNGQLLSFFCKQHAHVVLRKKEALVERPHGHIMQSRAGLIANENIICTTAHIHGIFNSHLSQGNTNFNRFLSASSSQFNLEKQSGQRIFVAIEGTRYLLGVPSAFEMGLNYCRWIYKYNSHCLQVRSWTSKSTEQVNLDFKVLSGNPINVTVSHHLDAANGWHISSTVDNSEFVFQPNPSSKLAEHYPSAQFKILIHKHHTMHTTNTRLNDESLYCAEATPPSLLFNIYVADTANFCMSFVGEIAQPANAIVIGDSEQQWQHDCVDGQQEWKNLSEGLALSGDHPDVCAIREILPWYGVNALTHFLTPHGLEQTDGAAWGTRDTSQGPIELLLATHKFDAAKQTLRTLFSHQDPDGGWPQWWMFDRYSHIRADHAHGDVAHWCLIALCDYIKSSNDIDFLHELLPYYSAKTTHRESTPLYEHIDRLLRKIIDSFIPGTALMRFGGGDWNDAMQPVNIELAQRLISSWTVELNYQAFTAYRKICELAGLREQAEAMRVLADQIKSDFNKHLIKNDVVAGHGLLNENGNIELLLHPSDNKTNIQYRLLPMIRGIISGIFTNKQAEQHLALIEQHLKGPDGARLMNRPPKYNGGIQTFFQRAESSSFFGREIGIMYTHAHLRYAESQARTGRAELFMRALRQANPVAYREIVQCGDFRQANCYYSSSDATFKSRYEADEKYANLLSGEVILKGGWRIYSSGPGIYIGLIVSRLLGLRNAFRNTVIDPVIAKNLNGFSASIRLLGRPVTFYYNVQQNCFGPKVITINHQPLSFEREENPYRLGGALVPTNTLLSMLNQSDNRIDIFL